MIVIKTIAIDIDDTLNNFTEVLTKTEIPYDEKYGLDKGAFEKYNLWIKSGIPDEELNNKYIRKLLPKVHREVYKNAQVKSGASEFTKWLKDDGWRIVIMTYRDLRHCLEITKDWLKANGILYDYIFHTDDKIAMCRLYNIEFLIEDNSYDVLYAPGQGIKVFYPITNKSKGIYDDALWATHRVGFKTFNEVKQCIG